MENTTQAEIDKNEYSEQALRYVVEVVLVCIGGALINWFLYGVLGGAATLFVLFVNFAVVLLAIHLLFKRIDELIIKRMNELDNGGTPVE